MACGMDLESPLGFPVASMPDNGKKTELMDKESCNIPMEKFIRGSG